MAHGEGHKLLFEAFFQQAGAAELLFALGTLQMVLGFGYDACDWTT